MAETRRRRSSFGGVRKLPSGFFQASITDPANPTKRINAPSTFRTKAAARAWLAQQQVEIERGTWRHPNDLARDREREQANTLGAFVEAWWSEHPWSASMMESEWARYRRHIKPVLGKVPLNEITPRMAEEWLRGLKTLPKKQGGEATPALPPTRKKALALLTRVLNEAVDRDLLEVNPLAGRRFLQRAARQQAGEVSGEQERRLWPVGTIRGLLSEVPPHNYALWILLACCGLRISEARPLRRGDLDLKNGWIFVSHVITGQGRYETHRQGTKSRAGERAVALAPRVVEAVKEHCRKYGIVARDAFVFPAMNDPARCVPASVLRAQSQRACKRMGMDEGIYIRPHELRHAVVSYGSRIDGITEADIKAFVGHSKGADITQRYSHSDETQQRLIAEGLAQLYLAETEDNLISLRKAE